MAIKANIEIDQGTDFYASIDLIDEDGIYDLANHTVAAQMRKNYASQTAIDFDVTINEDFGRILLGLSRSVTETLEPGRYLYDVEITNNLTDRRARAVEGIATVTPGITRT